MIKSGKHEDVFNERMKALKFIAKKAPNRVSCADLAETLNGCLRSHQRLLTELVKLGYLTSDNYKPRGYQVNKEKLEEFRKLWG